MQLTPADNGSLLSVKVGDRIVINLPENPSTGLQWDIESIDNVILTLQQSGFSFEARSQPEGSGQRIFIFLVLRPGNTELHLKLWRKWQADASVAERFSITLHSDL